jgi:outer membrane protein assembly factor BamB
MNTFFLLSVLALSNIVFASNKVESVATVAANAPKISIDKKQTAMVVQNGKTTTKIQLNLPKDMEVESKPEYFGSSDFALIAIAASEVEAATTLYYALDASGKKIWFLDMLTFNPAPPLIEKDFVYLSGTGKVFKVNKKSGQVVWSHDNLYENKKYEFNGADSILRKDDIIIFSPKVHVKDDSGKLIEERT